MGKSRYRIMRRRLVLICALLLALAVGIVSGALADDLLDRFDIRKREIPDNEAMAFLRRMGVGWNLGNTFDAWRDGPGDEMSIESYWCGILTTEDMIDAVRGAGFATLRLPVSWHDHVDAEYNISSAWLERVREVADWALSRGMTVILNTHHDMRVDICYPTEELYEQSERYLTRVWAQLAERFADCDDHLIFESMNEPRLVDTQWEWQLDPGSQRCLEAVDCINRLNQAFVDTVRAGGGNNARRYLMVPGYDAAPANALGNGFVLPRDSADNRIIVSVHAYTPYSFALQAGGTDRFKLTAGVHTREIASFMNKLYDQFISQGIPVVIGEFGARDKDGNTQARADYAAYYTAMASARNIPCCWWDNGIFSGDGERFALLRREDSTWPLPGIVRAIVEYGGYDSLP